MESSENRAEDITYIVIGTYIGRTGWVVDWEGPDSLENDLECFQRQEQGWFHP